MTEAMRAHRFLVVLLATAAAFVLATALSTSALLGGPSASAGAQEEPVEGDGEDEGEDDGVGLLESDEEGEEGEEGLEDDGFEDDGFEDDGLEDDGLEDDGFEDDGSEDEEDTEVLDESFEADDDQAMPTGGVDAGFGGLATAEGASTTVPATAAIALLGAAAVALVTVRRRGLVG
jgi:hypothetical protein